MLGMAVTPVSGSAHPERVEPSLVPSWLGALTGSPGSGRAAGHCHQQWPRKEKGAREGQGLGNHWLQLGRIISLVGLDFP